VLHVINGEHFAGAERVQDLLAAQLPAFGFDVGFACVKPGIFPKVRKTVTAPIYLTPMSSRGDMRAAWRLADVVRQEGYALVHAHTPRSVLVARIASALTRVPLVYHLHSPAARDTTHRWRNRVNQWTERLSLIGVTAVVTVSSSLRRQLITEGYSEQMVRCVPNGVPAPLVKRSDAPPGPVWTVGTTALFRPRKGMEHLLAAIALLHRLRYPVKLRAVGPFETPEYEQALRRRVEELQLNSVVEWTGFTSDVSAELARMDVFVLPSLFGEGMPMVVLEAMAAGVPVVATRVEGTPEAIEDGVSGLIADPANSDALAQCIARIVRGEVAWDGLRHNAMCRHAQFFSDQIMAERIAEVYRQVLGDIG
jgi:glycosyltransferase involved in cell wall biosynthesis